MKYKGILIFLIAIIIVLSCSLIAFYSMSKNIESNYNVSKNTENSIQNKNDTSLNENTEIDNTNSIEDTSINETSENEIKSTEKKDVQLENAINEENKVKVEKQNTIEKEKVQTQNKNQEKHDKAINITKNEWGKDDKVYYTIDRENNNIYYVSVRSKSTTETLAEYEVDVVNETIEIR